MVEELEQRSRGKLPAEDIIYKRIIELIMDKQLRPGQRLNEAKLASAYDIPRSRARRVLERLRDEEIVVFELNKGAFLRRPTVEEAHHVFEMRRHLEYTAIRLVCDRVTDADIAALRNQIEHEHSKFRDERKGFNRVAGDFHELLARMTRNPVLEKVLIGLVRRCVLIQSVYEGENKALCLSDEHKKILELIENKNPDEAISHMSHHFDHIISSLELTETRQMETDIYAPI